MHYVGKTRSLIPSPPPAAPRRVGEKEVLLGSRISAESSLHRAELGGGEKAVHTTSSGDHIRQSGAANDYPPIIQTTRHLGDSPLPKDLPFRRLLKKQVPSAGRDLR